MSTTTADKLQEANVPIISQFHHDVARVEKLEPHIQSGALSPLEDTPGRPWSAERPATVRLIKQEAKALLEPQRSQ